MIVIQVTGGRDWDNEKVVRKVLKESGGDLLRHGDCRGLDRQAGKVAAQLGMEIDSMPAEWMLHVGCKCSAWQRANSYCFFAGPRRNREMLDKGCNLVLAFSNNIAKSKGTKDCVNEAVRRGLRVYLFDNDGKVTHVRKVIP